MANRRIQSVLAAVEVMLRKGAGRTDGELVDFEALQRSISE